MIIILILFSFLINSKIYLSGDEVLNFLNKEDIAKAIIYLNQITSSEDKFAIDAEPYYKYVSNLILENNCKTGAEIGVYFGGLSEVLLLKNNLDKFYLIDSYPLLLFGDQLKADLYYLNLLSRMKEIKTNNFEIIREDSKLFVNNIPDNSLDFVFIDASHEYEDVKLDIKDWYLKVKQGGLVMGDDYNILTPGVIQAVNEFAKIYNYKIIVGCDRIWSFLKNKTN
jgi:hypothetical protein